MLKTDQPNTQATPGSSGKLVTAAIDSIYLMMFIPLLLSALAFRNFPGYLPLLTFN